MLDTKEIDARIRKLQKLKEVLSDAGLRELIADPELLALLKGAVSTNGNGSTTKHEIASEQIESEDKPLPAEGSLKRKVLDTARTLGKFTGHDIINNLVQTHDFGRNPMIAVNQALRHLSRGSKPFIRVVRSGSGRIPHIYEASRKEASQN